MDRTKPPIGLNWKVAAGGRKAPYWVAPTRARAAGFTPVTANLTFLVGEVTCWCDCSPFEQRQLETRCIALQSEANQFLAELAGLVQPEPLFGGRIDDLLDMFELHPDSPLHEKRNDTKRFYQQNGSLLRRVAGGAYLHQVNGLKVLGWYRDLKQPAKPDGETRSRRALAVMQTLRRIVSFGVMVDIPECDRLSLVLRNMRFEHSKRRTAALSFDQAVSIIEQAHAQNRGSIALAQAFQFELTLRQRDVIGEWEPLARKARDHEIARGGSVWGRGILWTEIDGNLMLRHETSKTAAAAEFDLNGYPLVMAELANLKPENRAFGALIKDEDTGLPYDASKFRKLWRKIATKAGVPVDVRNMDSRAGGISEGETAGASVSDLQAHATHANPATTAIYMRGDKLGKRTAVAGLRVAHRAQNRS